ncbi:helix-turn-helix domain-containing protein [Corynebacterium aurimucosum]|uniref:helix-turn-helix domain-containing protein n=1 Tax=Corynebacterium aurimucosum TaxID=169292 RepID=UPI003990B44D
MTSQQMRTIAQVSEFTQLSPRTIRRYIAEGRLVAYRAGRAIRLKQEDVDALFTPTNKWSGGDD